MLCEFKPGIAAYVTRQKMLKDCPLNYRAVLNSIILAKCIESHLWENSIFVSKQLKGIGPTFSTLLATAGKINFMLLEESHPRDLERVMNKGPPAGNILRKQISLLPKYQLTMTAIDENSVKLHLVLLNQMYLAENIEQLTAGAYHKCYIIVGDTDNHLLLLSLFKDKDLINIHDGQMVFDIIRRHNFDHKIIAHCISTSIAGIDVQCEYFFKSLEIFHTEIENKVPYDEKAENKHKKQSAITDAFKVRKRKKYDNEVLCPTENRKRDLPVIERLKYFNQSFIESHNNVDKEMNEDLVTLSNNKSLNQRNYTFGQNRDDNAYHTTIASVQNYRKTNIEDDELINNILNEIEIEKSEPDSTCTSQFGSLNMMIENNEIANKIYNNKMKTNNVLSSKKKKSEPSNFDVIIDIEKKANLFDELEATMINEENTFANTVKTSIDQYLQQTKRKSNVSSNIDNSINTNKPSKNEDTSKYDIDIKISSKTNPYIDDIPEYCEDMITGNTLNNIKKNDAEFIIDYERKKIDKLTELEFGILSREAKQNYEIDHVQNNNNSSFRELTSNFISLPVCNDNLLMVRNTQCLNEKLNHKLDSVSILNFKVNSTKNFKSALIDNKYSMPTPLTKQSLNSRDFFSINSNINKTQDINESELICDKNIISIETKDGEKLSPKSACNTQKYSLLTRTNVRTEFEQNYNQNVSNILLNDSTKKLSYTNTHINLYKNNNSQSNYCLIRKVKIDVDVMATICASKEKNAVVMTENKPNENGDRTEYIKLENNQCKSSASNLHFLDYDTNQNQDKKVNEDFYQGNGRFPENTNEYAEKSFPTGLGSSQQNSTVKGIIHKYKEVFSRKVKTPSQQNRQPSVAPNDGTKNLEQNKKYKRQYSITSLPNPNLQLNSQIKLQHSFLRMNVNESDNLKNNNTDLAKNERNGDDTLVHNDAVQQKNMDLSPKHSPTKDFESPQYELTQLSINNDCINVNPSIFNSRALLEFLNVNDVIPPPPQFSDEINIPSNPDNIFLETESNSLNYVLKKDNTLNVDNVNDYDQYKKTEPTLSKEIETWTLARDNADTELPKSITIRNNTAKNRFVTTSRKSKLKNFQYSCKKVFKQRK